MVVTHRPSQSPSLTSNSVSVPVSIVALVCNSLQLHFESFHLPPPCAGPLWFCTAFHTLDFNPCEKTRKTSQPLRQVCLSVGLDPPVLYHPPTAHCLGRLLAARRHSIVPSHPVPSTWTAPATTDVSVLPLPVLSLFTSSPRLPSCPLFPDQTGSKQVGPNQRLHPLLCHLEYSTDSLFLLSISAFVLAQPDVLLPLVTSTNTGIRLASRRVPPITNQHFAARVDQTSTISSLCLAALCVDLHKHHYINLDIYGTRSFMSSHARFH